MALDSRSLAVFQAIARAGSLTGAAIRLNMTQPAVTKSLRRLEFELGAPLFERTSKGVSLTTTGRLVEPYAELINAELGALQERINAARGLGRSTLRLGVLGIVAATLLPRLITALVEQQPTYRVHVLEGIDDALLAALRTNEIDLAVSSSGDANEEVQVCWEGSFSYELVVMASDRHPLRAKPGIELRDLLDFPWILPPSHVSPMIEFRRRFAKDGLAPPEPLVETRSSHVIQAIVATSDFLSWQPRALITGGASATGVSALDVDAVQLQRQFFVMRRRKGVLPPAARLFVEILTQLAPAQGEIPVR